MGVVPAAPCNTGINPMHSDIVQAISARLPSGEHAFKVGCPASSVSHDRHTLGRPERAAPTVKAPAFCPYDQRPICSRRFKRTPLAIPTCERSQPNARGRQRQCTDESTVKTPLATTVGPRSGQSPNVASPTQTAASSSVNVKLPRGGSATPRSLKEKVHAFYAQRFLLES